MKNTLITLTADDTSNEAIFRSLFNDDIIISPNSEMALQSISINKRIEIINIDSNNDQLDFQIVAGGGGGTHSIRLTHGTYTKDSFITLFTDIQNKMNSQLSVISSKEYGTEIVVGLSSS